MKIFEGERIRKEARPVSDPSPFAEGLEEIPGELNMNVFGEV